LSGIEIGSAVISKAGRDKGRKLVVVGFENGTALTADGKMRKLANPKKKNLRHLQATGTVLAEEEMKSDSEIRQALAEHFGGTCGKER
jgi:large subunit ribosomal protein L14e